MQFEITTKDKEGNVLFSGTLTQQEASFVLSVGMNYLIMNGAAPANDPRDETL